MVLGLYHLRNKKIRSRGRRVRFIYRVQLLEIKSWFASQQSVVSSQPISTNAFLLRWHRGTHRAGLAPSKIASIADGTIAFNHGFELPVTLRCSSPSSAFDEKVITFTLLDAQYSDAGPPLARGSLNLAAYGASGFDKNEPVTTTARVPLILCRHVTSKVVVPHLHVIITSSLCSKACFGEAGEYQAKAQAIIRNLPKQTIQLLRKQTASPPPLNSRSHEELVAALLEEEDEHEEEEEEAEIESFTDDESLSVQHTPSEENSLEVHQKENITSNEDKTVVLCDSPPSSSRKSAAQFAWTPTPRRPSSDESMAPPKAASELDRSGKDAFTPLSQGSDDTLSSPCPDPSSTLQTGAKLRAGQLAERRGTTPTEYQHDRCNSEPTDIQVESHQKGNNGKGNDQRASEAEALRHRIISQLHEKGLLRLDFDDLNEELMTDIDDFSVEEDINVLEEARRKFQEGAEQRDAKVTKRLLEETKLKLIDAEAKLFAASENSSFLQLCIGALEGELQDVAVIEMFIFCTASEHGQFPHFVLTCACHLAKLHYYAFRNWSQQRRASLMESTVLGVLLATRACGQDVARLTFWWSNVLALRRALSLPLGISPVSSSSEITRGFGNMTVGGAKDGGPLDPVNPALGETCGVVKSNSNHWTDAESFSTALKKAEASIFVKVVEAVWSQVFAPLTHKATYPLQQTSSTENVNKDDAEITQGNGSTSMVFDLEDGMHQNASIDIWKKAFLDALERLCPVFFGGNTCSCIPGLPRLVVEECVARLDVLMFNAILPIPQLDASTKPAAEVVFDSELLPIPPGHLTFGAGVQLKNVVGTWSTWLTILLEKLTSSVVNDATDDSRRFISFPLLKALADLLMLPRDMVADKSVRKEVCPVLTLPVVRRIMLMVEPDDFAPEAVSPSLLAALNAEIEMEKRMHGDVESRGFSMDGLALEPELKYLPCATPFKDLLRELLDTTVSEWAKQDWSAGDAFSDLKKMFGELVQTFSYVTPGAASHPGQLRDVQKERAGQIPLHRYKLLQELWVSDSTGQALPNIAFEDLPGQC